MSIRRIVPIEDAEWSIAPAPAWVEERDPDWSFAPPDGHAVAVLLLDEQHHVATQAFHSRLVRRLLTPAAVQALAQVAVDFDPAAQRLQIHELAIWRQGADARWTRDSRLRREALLLRQREPQLEQQMLTGRVTVMALLEDVRVGDAIETSWTLEPRDPLPGLHFTAFFGFVWTVPLARAFFTLHLSAEDPVQWRIHAPADAALPDADLGPSRATWSVERPPVFVPEPNASAGDWPFAVLDASAWTSWSEVARFFAQLWSDALGEGAEGVAEEAARLGSGGTPASAVRAAIRFVQEEIRYLAVDFGHGAGLLPSGAGTVLRRRFGDCKDKAVLLSALLRSFGVEAWPLLVAANWREAIRKLQPSTAAFNHAIVTFLLDGRRHFVDPTLVGQGGDLDHLVPPPFGCGLEVRRDGQELLPLPELPRAELTLTETFHLDRQQREGAVEQVLCASAWLADSVRAALVREGRAAFFKGRAEGLQQHFPALRPGQATAVNDDLAANRIELQALHELPTWGATGEKPPAIFRYGAYGLSLAMERIEGPEQRRQAWALPHPITVRHRVVVRGKCVGEAKAEVQEFQGPGFRYRCEVSGRRNEVTFDYRWETTRREVRADEWPEYRRERSRALDRAGGANVATVRPARTKPWSPPLYALGVLMAFAAIRACADGLRSEPRRTSPAEVSARIDRDLAGAREALRRGDYRRAESLLEGASAGGAKSLALQSLRAELALRTGRFDTARQAITEARALAPDGVQPDMLEAALEEAVGDLAAARGLLERARAKAPDDPRILPLLAWTTERMGALPEARSEWEQVLARQPAHPDALLHYALILWGSGERARADAVLTDAIRAQATPSPVLEAALARYYSATGRKDDALAAARRAVALAPHEASYAIGLADALARAGDEASALASARKLVEQFPMDRLAWGTLATLAAKAGDTRTAEQAFRTWMGLVPDDADAPANYGIFLHLSGRSSEARSVLEKTTRDHPGHGLAWLNYATVLQALGEARAAEEARRKADALMTDEQRANLLR